MSFQLTCPNCGPREVYEFRYGGEIIASTTEGGTAEGANLPQLQRERWFHRFGCRRWLQVERDVRSNTVFRTGWLEDDAT